MQIVSFCLCIIICFNNYAINASDDTAFITKEEFDRTMADFNARLTTFESGINSKIDSQVTSYLDRNGIWSAAKQEVKTTKTKVFGLRKISDTKYTIFGWYYIPGKDLKKEINNFNYATWNNHSYYFGVDDSGTYYDFVDSCTKSGLMCLVYSKKYGMYTGERDNPTFVQHNIYVNSYGRTSVTGDWPACALCTNFMIYEQKNGSTEETAIFNDNVYNVYPVPGHVTTATYANESKFFFVNKGSKLRIKTLSTSVTNYAGCEKDGFGIRYYDISANVY